MTTDLELDRVLATVTAALNEHRLETFDAGAVQEIIRGALGAEAAITVDDGGGLHDASGARIGALRRIDSGEWIAERQNRVARRAERAIPAQPPDSKLRAPLGKLRVPGP